MKLVAVDRGVDIQFSAQLKQAKESGSGLLASLPTAKLSLVESMRQKRKGCTRFATMRREGNHSEPIPMEGMAGYLSFRFNRGTLVIRGINGMACMVISRPFWVVAALALLWSTTRDAPQPSTAAELPSSEGTGFFCMPVSLGGNSLLFALDTGAQVHGMAEETLQLLGSNASGIIPTDGTGDSEAKIYKIPEFHIAGQLSQMSYAVPIDIRRLEMIAGKKLDGALGVYALHMGPILLRHGREAVFWDRESDFFYDNKVFLFLDRFGRVYTNDFVAGGSQQFALLDTGFTGGICLGTPLFDGLIADGQIEAAGTETYMTVYGDAEVRTGTLRSLRIGKIELQDVPVIESDRTKIGLQILANFDALIDVHNRHMLIRNTKSVWTLGKKVVQVSGKAVSQKPQ